MKAYKIAIDGTVTEFDNTGLESIYAAIGCTCIDAVRTGGGNVLYVDDDGLLKPNIINAVASAMTLGKTTKIVGDAVLVGTTRDGDDAEPDPKLVAVLMKESKKMRGMIALAARKFGFDTPAEMFEHALKEAAQ